jgi:hypothetical protein
VITVLWELSKDFLKEIHYSGDKTFGKMTSLTTEVFPKEENYLKKDTYLERST